MTPACAGRTEDWRHCWHFPRGFMPDEDADPTVTVTCCDCGLEAWVDSFNRRAGTHGPARTGAPMERRQMRWRPLVRVLPALHHPRPAT
jgi:hypothetical protein